MTEDNVLYKDRHDVQFTDIVQLFCRFCDELEFAANEPTQDHLVRRIDYLNHQVHKLKSVTQDRDRVEQVRKAADVAFVAITQLYNIFRHAGFTHHHAITRARTALMEVGKSNMMKNVPVEAHAPITKPEGWIAPELDDIFVSSEDLLAKRKKEEKENELKAEVK